MRWPVLLTGLVMICIAGVAVHGATVSYGLPIAGLLVTPDAVISNTGLPTWSGVQQGLRYPDRVLKADGVDITSPPPGEYPATAFDAVVARAAKAGRPSVAVEVQTANGVRKCELAIERIGSPRVVDLRWSPLFRRLALPRRGSHCFVGRPRTFGARVFQARNLPFDLRARPFRFPYDACARASVLARLPHGADGAHRSRFASTGRRAPREGTSVDCAGSGRRGAIACDGDDSCARVRKSIGRSRRDRRPAVSFRPPVRARDGYRSIHEGDGGAKSAASSDALHAGPSSSHDLARISSTRTDPSHNRHRCFSHQRAHPPGDHGRFRAARYLEFPRSASAIRDTCHHRRDRLRSRDRFRDGFRSSVRRTFFSSVHCLRRGCGRCFGARSVGVTFWRQGLLPVSG